MLALMRTILARPRHLLWLVIAALLIAPSMMHAQTIKIADTQDSIVRITKAGGTTFDSAFVVTSYGARSIARYLKANATDTVRFARIIAPAAQSDSVKTNYTPIPKAKVSGSLVAAKVVVPPPVVVVAPPVTQPSAGSAYVVPALPDTFTVPFPATARRIAVPAGADLQAALNAARPGDELVLADTGRWVGNFVLPNRMRRDAWIVIRSETCTPAGQRTDTSTRALIQTPNSDAAVRVAMGDRYRLACLEIAHKPGAVYNYGIVVLGRGDETSTAQQPSDIVLDRVWVHGSTAGGNSRCVALNGARLAVIDSYLSECHAKGFDAQGVGGWSGTGPYLIENNRIEASGQGVMFGGADPYIVGASPSDVTIRRNYIVKPLSWGGGKWSVKAAFELKHARRVLFEGNVIENHWAESQVGFAILLQTLADNNTSWNWTTVQDITIRNNVIRNSTSGVNMLARVAYCDPKPCNAPLPTNPTSRVLLQNNLFENVGLDPISNGAGIGVQLLADLVDVTVTNNTFTLAGKAQKALSFDGKAQTRTTITDNIFTATQYQITGNSTGAGNATLSVFMPGGLFQRNTLPGANAKDFSAEALANGAGVDLVQLNAAIAGVVK